MKRKFPKKQMIFKLNLKRGLGRTLLIWFITLAIVPLIVISIISSLNTQRSLYEREKQNLKAEIVNKENYINFYFSRMFTDLDQQSNEITNIQFITELHSSFIESKKSVEDFVKSYKWALIDDKYGADLKVFQKIYKYHDVILLDTDGNVLFSVAHESDFGTNLFYGKYSNTKFAAACKKAFQEGAMTFSDFEFYDPSNNLPTGFIASLIVDEYGEKIGVIAFQISIDHLNKIVQEKTGLGKTEEIYLIGSDLKMRSESYLDEDSTLLTKTIDTKQTNKWYKTHFEEGIVECNHYPEVYIGPRGKAVLGVHKNILIKDVHLGLFAEIENSEAFYLTRQIQFLSVLLVLITIIVVIFIAIIVTEKIVKPLRNISEVANKASNGEITEISYGLQRKDEIGTLVKSFDKLNKSNFEMTQVAEKIANGDLTLQVTPRSEEDVLGKAFKTMVDCLRERAHQAEEIAKGNLTIEVEPISDKDTLGTAFKTMVDSLNEKVDQAQAISEGNLKIKVNPLSDEDAMGTAFKIMVERLNSQINEITEGVNVLATSTSEIMASVTQMASSAAETATSVSETTTTVEEVKQTAEVSNHKAKEISESAIKTSEISKEGTKAINNTLEGMNRVKQQMESIANMVVSLSEQSQVVGEITATVNDLAEQSNLLAVNAAIEAAKAGEQGKGFSVVAQEIKNLAERSKEATTQVGGILKDIQKSVSSAVMATEEGGKAVEEGLKLTTISGETISLLSENVDEASNVMIQIAASSQQQLEGMDQMVSAMENIKESSVQAAASTQQSALSVNELKKLGDKLQELMYQYERE